MHKIFVIMKWWSILAVGAVLIVILLFAVILTLDAIFNPYGRPRACLSRILSFLPRCYCVALCRMTSSKRLPSNALPPALRGDTDLPPCLKVIDGGRRDPCPGTYRFDKRKKTGRLSSNC